MLLNVTTLRGRTVHATDGDIGRVEDIYFDDERWGVRYLVVDTGGWLAGRRVLISPATLQRGVATNGAVHVALTRAQVEASPDVDTDKPVSRHYEIAHAMHYGYPNYWTGPLVWGAGVYPGVIPLSPAEALPEEEAAEMKRQAEEEEAAAQQCHLRSVREVVGYGVDADDGAAGTVDDFVVDDETWAIRHIVVDARKWLPGGQVLVEPSAVTGVDWPSRRMRLHMTRDAVKQCPPLAR